MDRGGTGHGEGRVSHTPQTSIVPHFVFCAPALGVSSSPHQGQHPQSAFQSFLPAERLPVFCLMQLTANPFVPSARHT